MPSPPTTSSTPPTATPYLLIHRSVHSVQLGQPHEVGSHKDLELQSLLLSLGLLSAVALVLHAYPQLVHLCKVLQYECD